MKFLRSFLYRLKVTFGKNAAERDMAEQMQHHLELMTEENMTLGMSPEDAKNAARRKFGGVEQVKEACRDQRSFGWIENLGQDLRYAVRQWRRSPGFATIAVVSLALGLGANTALFSLIDEVLLRSLPVDRPDELAQFRWLGGPKRIPIDGIQGKISVDPSSGLRTSPFFSHAAFEHFQSATATLNDVFAFGQVGVSLVIDGRMENARCEVVSADYFGGLGVRVMLGRTLSREDQRADAAPALVISHAFWQSRLGGAADVLGKVIQVDGVAFTVVGVTPPGFAGAGEYGEAPAAFLPMAVMPRLQGDMGFLKRPLIWWVNIMGRLKSGASLETAEAELNPVFLHATEAAWREGGPGVPGRSLEGYSLPRLRVISGAQGLTGTRQIFAQTLFLLAGIVGGVLVLTCLNVGSLLLARSLVRQKEIAVRLSLGAGRGRIIRQLLTESALLSLAGGSLGLLLAYWGRDALLQLWPIGNGEFALDGRVFGFAFGLSLVSGLVFGLGPAWRASRLGLDAALKSGAGGSVDRSRVRLRGILMVGQVTIAVVLLVGTGLFLRTLRNFARVDVGFERNHLVYFNLDPGLSRSAPAQRDELYRRVRETVDRLPGVQSSASVARVLLSGSHSTVKILLENPKLPSDLNREASINSVSASFFATMGIALPLGRTFDPREREGTHDVAIVNETFAKTYFPGEYPVGRTFGLPGSRVTSDPERKIEIIGLAADAKYADLRSKIPPTIYYPLARPADGWFVVRTIGEPRAIITSLRAALREMAPDADLINIRTQQETVDRLLTMERLFVLLCTLFASVALALTCLGLYGLLAYDVSARTREIGLRLALGSPVRAVTSLIIARGMKLMVLGLGLGLIAAAIVTRFIATLLFQVPPTDYVTYVGVAFVLTAVGLLACWLPARRAAQVDPMIALRME